MPFQIVINKKIAPNILASKTSIKIILSNPNTYLITLLTFHFIDTQIFNLPINLENEFKKFATAACSAGNETSNKI